MGSSLEQSSIPIESGKNYPGDWEVRHHVDFLSVIKIFHICPKSCQHLPGAGEVIHVSLRVGVNKEKKNTNFDFETSKVV